MSKAAELYEPPAGQHPIRGHIRRAGHDRVTHGLFLPEVPNETDDDRWRRILFGWLMLLPVDAVLTHLTAARLYGWQVPKLPEHLPVFAAVGKKDRRPRREGLVCSRLTRRRVTRIVAGFPVDEPEEVLLRASRDLGVLDITIMLDSARRCHDVDEARLQAILDSGRPGTGVLRAARLLSDAHHESAGESILGVFHAAIQVQVETQVEIFDGTGNLLGRVDALVTGTTWVHEYDGAVHRTKSQHRTDLRRERAWGSTPYRRKGFTLDDLLNHSTVVMHEIDRDLGRPHVNHRLWRWRTLVRESLYDEVGRARVLNRWHRAMGIVQWS